MVFDGARAGHYV